MTESMLKSHSKYSHVFAICRIDHFQLEANSDFPLEQAMTVTKVVTSQIKAEQEVERLNNLPTASDGKVRYYWTITRLVSGE